MDCNPSAPSTSKNTNMNIRRQKNNKKTEENKRWKVTAGARAGIITDAGFIGGDRTGVTCCCEEKLKPYSLIVWGGEVRICQQEFSPPTKPSGVAMRAAGFGGLWAQYKNMSWKHKMILFHLLMAKHNTNNRHCGVKHKRQASVSCFIQVL